MSSPLMATLLLSLAGAFAGIAVVRWFKGDRDGATVYLLASAAIVLPVTASGHPLAIITAATLIIAAGCLRAKKAIQ